MKKTIWAISILALAGAGVYKSGRGVDSTWGRKYFFVPRYPGTHSP